MQFYRSLIDFKVISFDLDDTLYDNYPVILQAEQIFLDCIKKQSGINDFTPAYWHSWKNQVAQQHPLLCEDVTLWRKLTLQQLLAHHHKTPNEIKVIIATVLAEFLKWRHRIDVPVENIHVLDTLKVRYKLSVITNGNVDVKQIGLSHFDLALQGGVQGRAKPQADLFLQTARYFNVAPQQILHIGDHLTTDVQGAIQAGCQAAWLNLTQKTLRDFPEARFLPTLEITNLSELLTLI